jgi:hypothetical protein
MEPIKAFTNVVIGQFVLTRIPIKVYVDSRYLTITSTDDVQDPLIGFGMDEDGQMHRFDYRMVSQLLVGGQPVDLDTYNKAMGFESGGEAPAEEDAEEEPKKEESVQMTEISKDVLKAKLDVIKQQAKELKDKENALKKEPVEEELYQGEYTFGTGDIVKNINPSCEHFGSIGVVKKIMDLPNGMGKVAVYTVGNSGSTYKPGMSLTKTTDQLEKYNG